MFAVQGSIVLGQTAPCPSRRQWASQRTQTTCSYSNTRRPSTSPWKSSPQVTPRHRALFVTQISASDAVASPEIEKSASVESAVDTLKRAALSKSVPGREVFQAMRMLEKAKLKSDGWDNLLADNRGWRLVFTSSSKDIAKDTKGTGIGSGFFFPLAAAQRWDLTADSVQNGIYLSHVAALVFKGKMVIKSKRLAFDFDQLKLKLGPWENTFKLKDPPTLEVLQKDPKAPFFLFSYVDDDVIVARGRGGGLAFWARCTAEWELANGVV